MTLNKMESLRKIPVHPEAVRFVSCEPLLEDIAGYGWMIVGGESGTNPEYRWNPEEDWREEFERKGRREMDIQWAKNLLAKARSAGIPFFFKQIAAGKSEQGADALGSIIREVPAAPLFGQGLTLQKLHHQIIGAILRADVIEMADVGMVQRRDGASLAFHALFQLRRRRKMRSQNFYRHGAI
jgi:hypothetical protein